MEEEKWVLTPVCPDMLTILIIFIAVPVLVKLILNYRKPSKLPPGPWGLLILGHLPLMGKDPLETFHRFRKQYGDVYKIRFGVWPTVVINGKTAIKEALSQRGDAFSGRPEFLSVKLVSNMTGVSFGQFGDRYLMHRKIAGSVLKMFTGTRNVIIQEIIENEASHLVDEFLGHNGAPFDPDTAIFYAAGSVIFQVVYGRGKDIRQDEDFAGFVKNTKEFINFMKAGNPFDILPWMRFILPAKFKSFMNLMERTISSQKKKVKEIMETYEENDIRHAVDGLIASTKQYSAEEKGKVGLTDEQIFETTGDFLGAGFQTTATSLLWALMYFADNPNVQRNVQSELDNIIGCSRQTSIADRSRLPYTEATVVEILRMGSVAPLSLPHYTIEDTKLLGYDIPKGTVAFFNLHSANYDSDVWDSPYEFKPERFINKDGQLFKEKIDFVLSFGAGRRRCLGEQLARIELFLYISHLLQRCTVVKPSGETYNMKGEVTLAHAPRPYRIQVLPRD